MALDLALGQGLHAVHETVPLRDGNPQGSERGREKGRARLRSQQDGNSPCTSVTWRAKGVAAFQAAVVGEAVLIDGFTDLAADFATDGAAHQATEGGTGETAKD